jgi:hypothetical protein
MLPGAVHRIGLWVLFIAVWVEVGANKILSIPSSVYVHFVY